MAFEKMTIRQLKNRIIFLVIAIVSVSATMAFAVDINPLDIAMTTEKMGIVGVLVVVIVLQAVGLLYLLRLLGTKIINIIEQNSKINQQMLEAIERCKGAQK